MNNPVINSPVFHISVTVDSLEAARHFYGEQLGCVEGRSAPTWVDFDFFGHQLSLHIGPKAEQAAGQVDHISVPMPHFGAVLSLSNWDVMVDRIKKAGIRFVIEPQIRFQGAPEEQRTFFIKDPAGNNLEFKGAPNPSGLLEA
jgi:uncharacterized protein